MAILFSRQVPCELQCKYWLHSTRWLRLFSKSPKTAVFNSTVGLLRQITASREGYPTRWNIALAEGFGIFCPQIGASNIFWSARPSSPSKQWNNSIRGGSNQRHNDNNTNGEGYFINKQSSGVLQELLRWQPYLQRSKILCDLIKKCQWFPGCFPLSLSSL